MTSPNIKTTHAFTTRLGGISDGIYNSLNLGKRLGDEQDNVKENYKRLCNTLSIIEDDLVVSNQVHGATIRVVSKDDRGQLFSHTRQEADGMITCDSDVALMVYTGDCVPILLNDPVCKVVGAVHAGWRGTAADIMGAVVKKMMSEFGCNPCDISASIGPCISKCCFETDADVADAIMDALQEKPSSCIKTIGEKYLVDLKEANRLMLGRAGVVNITVSDECTSCLSDKYWSHRKTKGKRGSQAAMIIL